MVVSYGNCSGAMKLFRGAQEKLAPYGDDEAGLDMRKLKADVARSLARLAGRDEPDGLSEPAEGLPEPPFEPFEIGILDESLAAQVAALALVPLEERLAQD